MRFNTLKCDVFSQKVFTAQIMLGLGVDASGNVTNLYTGADAQAAKDAVDSAGTEGQSLKATFSGILSRT